MTAAAAPPASGPRPRTVVHLITTLTQGGAERVLSEVVPRPGERGLDGAEERHVVVSLVPGGMFADVLRARGVEVRDLGMRPGRDLVRGIRRLRVLERELAPDMVVAWMYHACLLVLLAGPTRRRRARDAPPRTRTVWFLQGALHTLTGLPWHTRLTVRILARTARAPDAVAINSRTGRAHHVDLGYRPRRWVILANGCDAGTFRPDAGDRAAVRAELGLGPSDVAAICVARVHPQKDHPTLLAAVGSARERVPGLVLLLVGTGTDGLAAATGDPRVIGLGPRADVPRLLRGADLLVMSSTTEGLPNALLEGMATGLPPVVTDVGDCRDVVGMAGHVVPPHDVLALADAVVAVAGAPAARRTALGAAARDRVVARHGQDAARREYRALWDPAADRAVRAARPVRVAHVIARMNVGGPARILAGLLEGVDPTAVEQTLLTGAVGAGEEDWFRLRGGGDDPRVVRIPSFGRAIDPVADLRTMRRLTAVLRRLAPDVVQTHTAKAGLLGRIAARRAGVPASVHTFHGHTLHGYFPGPVAGLFTRLERRLARRTDRLLAVGARVRDDLLAAGIGRPEQYAVLPPGIPETDPIDRAVARAQLDLPGDVPVVAFVGRLTAVKRPDRFVAAAHDLAGTHPRTVFLVAGDGELRAQVEAAAAAGAADVRLLGWRPDVEVVLAASDVVALTSDNEGMPLTLIEAAMAGRPCVATDVGSAGEVVLDGVTGRIVAPDAEAVAAALREHLDDPGLAAQRGRAARSHARATYGVDALCARITSLHRDLLLTER